MEVRISSSSANRHGEYSYEREKARTRHWRSPSAGRERLVLIDILPFRNMLSSAFTKLTDRQTGGCFRARISFPPEYPHMPPKMKFKTPIYHPNSKHRLPSSPLPHHIPTDHKQYIRTATSVFQSYIHQRRIDTATKQLRNDGHLYRRRRRSSYQSSAC